MADTLSRYVPVYQYIFSFEVCEPSLTGSETLFKIQDPTRPAWFKPMRGSGLGIPHFDDMPYFFSMPLAGLPVFATHPPTEQWKP